MDEIRLDEGIDASFQDVISRMLKKLPDDRPTMKDVHYRLLHGKWPSASPTTHGTSVPAGPGKTTDGRSVRKAWLLADNPNKVTIEFSDGEKTTYDRVFAKAVRYIE